MKDVHTVSKFIFSINAPYSLLVSNQNPSILSNYQLLVCHSLCIMERSRKSRQSSIHLYSITPSGPALRRGLPPTSEAWPPYF